MLCTAIPSNTALDRGRRYAVKGSPSKAYHGVQYTAAQGSTLNDKLLYYNSSTVFTFHTTPVDHYACLQTIVSYNLLAKRSEIIRPQRSGGLYTLWACIPYVSSGPSSSSAAATHRRTVWPQGSNSEITLHISERKKQLPFRPQSSTDGPALNI